MPTKPIASKKPKATKDSAVAAMLAAIAKKQPTILKGLRPAATQADLDTLRKLGAPKAFIELYASHDGSDGEFLPPYTLLAVANIASERKLMNDLLAKNPKWKTDQRWKPEWIPFLGHADGQLLVLDPVGGTDGGPRGQIVAYDHETGPARELASFDVFVELVTELAKKSLLDGQAQEESPQSYEAIYAKAKNVGVPRMPAKELKKWDSRLRGSNPPSPQEVLEQVLPLARQFPAEQLLWGSVASAAETLKQWKLLALAAGHAVRLTPTRERPSYYDPLLVLALHRCGRDDAALNVLKSALAGPTNYPESLLRNATADGEPVFVQRCYALATDARPKEYNLWVDRGLRAKDPSERRAAFKKVIELTSDKKLILFNEGIAAKAQKVAREQLKAM